MDQQNFPGIYHFQRQELVASFYFPDQERFEFFYSYGAADRTATGTYTLDGTTVKLKSDKAAGNDFTIIRQEKRGGPITIKVTDPNPMLAEYVRALYFVNGQQLDTICNRMQEIIIPETPVGKIYLQHQLFPDVACQIKDDSSENDYFEVGLNPSLQQVSFKGIDLFITDEGLTCHPNYLLPIEGILFRKKGD
jgi:hypothetical protein